MKKIYIVGCEGTGSGMWDWYHEKEHADKRFQSHIEDFGYIEDEIIYRGELDVAENLTEEEITAHVENFLSEHGFEDAPLINHEIYDNL